MVALTSACTPDHARLDAVASSCDAIVEAGTCVDSAALDRPCDARRRRVTPCTRDFRFATCSTGTLDRHYYAAGRSLWNATNARRDCSELGGTFRTEPGQ